MSNCGVEDNLLHWASRHRWYFSRSKVQIEYYLHVFSIIKYYITYQFQPYIHRAPSHTTDTNENCLAPIARALTFCVELIFRATHSQTHRPPKVSNFQSFMPYTHTWPWLKLYIHSIQTFACDCEKPVYWHRIINKRVNVIFVTNYMYM